MFKPSCTVKKFDIWFNRESAAPIDDLFTKDVILKSVYLHLFSISFFQNDLKTSEF